MLPALIKQEFQSKPFSTPWKNSQISPLRAGKSLPLYPSSFPEVWSSSVHPPTLWIHPVGKIPFPPSSFQEFPAKKQRAAWNSLPEERDDLEGPSQQSIPWNKREKQQRIPEGNAQPIPRRLRVTPHFHGSHPKAQQKEQIQLELQEMKGARDGVWDLKEVLILF